MVNCFPTLLPTATGYRHYAEVWKNLAHMILHEQLEQVRGGESEDDGDEEVAGFAAVVAAQASYQEWRRAVGPAVSVVGGGGKAAYKAGV